jgi:hypothetical protein
LEKRLGEAMEENHYQVEEKVSNKKISIEEKRNQIWAEENHVFRTIATEEMESFVCQKRSFEKIKKVSKRLKYWFNCSAFRTCLENFRSCVKVVLILCIISARG